MNNRLRIFVAHSLSGVGILAMVYGLVTLILMLTSEVNTGWETLIYGAILYLMGQLTLLLHRLGANIGDLAGTLRFVARYMRDELKTEEEAEETNEEDIFADVTSHQPSLRVSSNT